MSNPVIYDTSTQDTNSENIIEKIKVAELSFKKVKACLFLLPLK